MNVMGVNLLNQKKIQKKKQNKNKRLNKVKA